MREFITVTIMDIALIVGSIYLPSLEIWPFDITQTLLACIVLELVRIDFALMVSRNRNFKQDILKE